MHRTPQKFVAPILTVATLVSAGCKPHQQAAEDPRLSERLVVVATAQHADSVSRTYTGLVEARVQSDLGFRVQGKIIERLADTGQSVKEGQPLMRIDATDYQHAVTARVGDVAAARARWIQAAADERRYRGLVASGAESESAYDQAKAAADSAQALLSAADAQEKVARNQNGYSTLVADADGTVVETLAEPGQVAAAGQIVIRLAHAGPREASIDLPEGVRPGIGSIAEVSLYGDATHVQARLRQLSDSADPHTRTFEARYVMEGAGAQAPLGATVTATLGGAGSASVLSVPLGALDDEGKGPGVWVVDRKTSKVAFQEVQVGALGGETAEITRGIDAGDQVVAVGGHYLHDGERVRVVDAKAAMQ